MKRSSYERQAIKTPRGVRCGRCMSFRAILERGEALSALADSSSCVPDHDTGVMPVLSERSCHALLTVLVTSSPIHRCRPQVIVAAWSFSPVSRASDNWPAPCWLVRAAAGWAAGEFTSERERSAGPAGGSGTLRKIRQARYAPDGKAKLAPALQVYDARRTTNSNNEIEV